MPETFRHPLRVRWHECDPQGNVFNANYLAYADVAITELYHEVFGSWQQPMDEHGLDVVVAEASVRFLSPLHFDDEVELVVTLTRIGSTATTTRVAVERDGEPAAVVELRHVFIDAQTREKTPIPDPIREALAPYVE